MPSRSLTARRLGQKASALLVPFLLLLPAVGAPNPPTGPGHARGLERLAWLAGCWEASSGDRIVEEQWMAPRAGNMVGISRTVRGDKLASTEMVLLRERGEQLAYVAHPSGQPGATFLSRSGGDSAVLFENPQHDFPQRIGYRLTRPDAMEAWIEGTVNGKLKRVDFAYRRVACPGGCLHRR